MTEEKSEDHQKSLPKNLWVYSNYFFIEDQLSELETGDDVAILFGKINMLEGDDGRRILKEALQIIGRRDIRKQFDIYLGAGM